VLVQDSETGQGVLCQVQMTSSATGIGQHCILVWVTDVFKAWISDQTRLGV
jgi:hypothetical protein